MIAEQSYYFCSKYVPRIIKASYVGALVAGLHTVRKKYLTQIQIHTLKTAPKPATASEQMAGG